MTIQVPNPGTGNGQTGDNEFVLWSKVKSNFEDQTNAASKLIGSALGQVPLAEQTYKAAFGDVLIRKQASSDNCNNFEGGTQYIIGTATTLNSPVFAGDTQATIETRVNYKSERRHQIAIGYSTQKLAIRQTLDGGATYNDWAYFYSTKNTTLDSNGALKPSSPVLQVYATEMTGNSDGDAMAATYTKNGVGDYTISGTTGLRSDGWYIVIPNDMNGNPKVAVTLDDTDGVITLKTYARIFDMTTFKFVPDLEQPLDIPDGRWIDLRFNDLPQAPQIEV